VRFQDPNWRNQRRLRGPTFEPAEERVVPPVPAVPARTEAPAVAREAAPRELGGLAGVLRELASAVDEAALVRALLRVVDHQAGPDAVGVLVEGADGWRVAAQRGLPESASRARIPKDGSVADQLRRGGSMHLADFRGAILRDFGATHIVPCADRGAAPMAVVLLGGDAAVLTVKALASVAALAIRGLRVPPAPEPIEVVRTVEVPVRVGPPWERIEPMLRALPLPSLLEHVVDVARDLSSAERATLMLKDDAAGDLVVRAVRGLPDPKQEKRIARGEGRPMRIAAGQGLPGKVFDTGAVVRARGPRDGGGEALSLGLPLVADGERLGVLVLTDPSSPEAAEPDGGQVGRWAHAAALAIARTLLLDRVARDGVTGLPRLPLVLREAEVAVRRGDLVTSLWWGIGKADGSAPDDKRLGRLVGPLRRALGDHAERCAVVDGRFCAVLVGVDGPSALKLAARVCNEMGTMHYGEASWCFAASARRPDEGASALLDRGRAELGGLGGDKAGIFFALDGKATDP
jgi:hypothetical protein